MGGVLAVDQRDPSQGVVERAASVLASSGVLVMPTDSVYGIGVAATSDNPGLARIFEIKRRDLAQTIPWLIADHDDLARFARVVPRWATELALRFWPGALTIVVDASDDVPPEYRRADDGTIALRMPDSELVRRLARLSGGALAVTSANSHGMPSPASFAALESRIVAEADLTLDGGAAPIGVASTIVGGVGPSPNIYREGGIPSRAIEEALS